jgi:hypothetical protein
MRGEILRDLLYDQVSLEMRGVICAAFSTILLLIPELAAAGRLTFDRIHRAPRDLGPVDAVALVYAIGDSDSISTFLDSFLYSTNQAGTLRVYDVRNVRRVRPTAVSLRVSEFHCDSRARSGEGSTRDYEGKRVRRRLVWADAVCEARIDIVRSGGTETFRVHGEGTSPRVEALTTEEIRIAVDQAARYTGVAAADEITPRRVRETIALDESAPAYDAGIALIDASRLSEARRMWEGMLNRYRQSAGLRFNLAAVCEALGDVRSAERYFTAARDLAPNDPRFRDELVLFNERNPVKK